MVVCREQRIQPIRVFRQFGRILVLARRFVYEVRDTL